MDDKFFKNLPKFELHAHLNGSLKTDTLLELGSLIYGEITDDFKRSCELIKLNQPSMEQCFNKFKFIHELTKYQDDLRRATLFAIRDFHADNVMYLELRTTIKDTIILSKAEYLGVVLEAINLASYSYSDTHVKLLPSIDRSKGVKEAEEILDVVLKARDKYPDIIKGIDFCGDPTKGSFKDYKDVLSKARENSLRLALHCGEINNPEEIADIIDFMDRMDRCGHGTFLNQEHLAILKRKNIPIECCLSSNVKCGTVASYKDHHFKHLLENKHQVVLCTDDSGIFDTTLSKEFSIAQKTFNLTKDDVFALIANAREAAFMDDFEKEYFFKEVHDTISKHFK